MTAVVTGAAGFLGSHLVDRLLADGQEVVAVDVAPSVNLADAAGSSGYRFVGGDIRDPAFVGEAIGPDVDIVYHFAAIVGVHKYLADPFAVVDVNVLGTRNVLAAAADHGTRVLVASTSEVFGKNPAIPWQEDDDRVLGSTAVDRWSYSTSKAAAEHLAIGVDRAGLAPVTVVRFFNAYGPRQAPIFVVSRAVHRVLNGLPPVVYDGGTQTRCFTFVDDAIDGTVAAATSEGAGEVFNLGNTTELSVAEATRIILEEAGAESAWEDFSTSEGFGDRYQDIDRRIPSSDKAARLLGWVADTDLRTGVAETIAWARAHPAWLALSSDTTESAPSANSKR